MTLQRRGWVRGLGMGHTLWAVGCMLLASCPAEPGPAAVSVEFGVFFGGQIQQRVEIPFQLDVSRQRHGFRLTRASDPERAEPSRIPLEGGPNVTSAGQGYSEVSWELSTAPKGRRVADSHGHKGQRSLVRLGQGQWPSREKQFEQTLKFRTGDPFGMWNIRIMLDGQAILDQPFTVYNARGRR